MAISNRISSRYRSLLVLVIALLLTSVCVVNAQTPSPTPIASPTASVTPNPTPTPSATPSAPQSPDQRTAISEETRAKLLGSPWYPVFVSLVFAVLILGFGGVIARVILRSKSSFRSPLGLPEGSLRAMLAFLLVAFLGFYVYESVLSLSGFRLPDALLGIIATVIGFYFGSRASDTQGSSTSGSIEGTVLNSAGSPALGATIELSQVGKKLTQTADVNGKFKFDNVPIGDYDIQASLTGHVSSDPAKVKVTAGTPQTVNLKLK